MNLKVNFGAEQMQVAEVLAWLSRVDVESQPDVEHRARLLLLDTVACAVRGLMESELQTLVRSSSKDEPGPVRWPGMEESLSPGAAAFVAAMSACWFEACEGLASAHGRPGLHAVPVAVSLGLARRASLGAVLDGILWGYEVGGRFGQVMRIRPGMHVDGTWGLFASTAAAARMIGASPDITMTALGIAACQIPATLYLPIAKGRTARNTYVGHAALTGMAFARSAASGVTSPTDDAFAEAERQISRRSDALDRWWTPPGRFLLSEGYLKPFAAARHVHYPAAAAIALRTMGHWEPETITSLTIETYPEAVTYCGNRGPDTPIQAQFSLSYGTARALLAGSLDPDAYATATLDCPMQRRLEAMAAVSGDPNMLGRGARVSIDVGGRILTEAVDSVLGDPVRPMQRPDVEEKAMRYMAPALGSDLAASIITMICDAPLDAPFTLG